MRCLYTGDIAMVRRENRCWKMAFDPASNVMRLELIGSAEMLEDRNLGECVERLQEVTQRQRGMLVVLVLPEPITLDAAPGRVLHGALGGSLAVAVQQADGKFIVLWGGPDAPLEWQSDAEITLPPAFNV